MRLERLALARFRGFEDAEWRPIEGANLITGGNGAGKTSLLEAAHVLANARSFRGRVRDGLVRHGCADLEIFGEWRLEGGPARRAGLRHSGRDWDARLDGRNVESLLELCETFSMLTFEPGSHELIAGGAEHRRRFMDWALFHVEPEFMALWRRYTRAARQRNALLKARPQPGLLETWDRELAAAGEPLTQMRAAHMARIDVQLQRTVAAFLPELGPPTLTFLPGWRRDEQSLSEALLASRERDIARGHSGVGPHRADWRIGFADLPSRNALSRGQEKLLALACLLAQARVHAVNRGHWPVMAMDDLASELDQNHQRRVLEELVGSGAQILVTATEAMPALVETCPRLALFHVEQGQVRRLV